MYDKTINNYKLIFIVIQFYAQFSLIEIPTVLTLIAAADIERINNKKKQFYHPMVGLERTAKAPGMLKREQSISAESADISLSFCIQHWSS
jgi:hypothetical protein